VRKDVGRDEFWEVFGEGKTHLKEKFFFTAAAAESELKIGSVFEENIGVFGEIVGEYTITPTDDGLLGVCRWE
jgi:hypothetical protein